MSTLRTVGWILAIIGMLILWVLIMGVATVAGYLVDHWLGTAPWLKLLAFAASVVIGLAIFSALILARAGGPPGQR